MGLWSGAVGVWGLSQGGSGGEPGCLLGPGSQPVRPAGLRRVCHLGSCGPTCEPSKAPLCEQLLSLSPWEIASETHAGHLLAVLLLQSTGDAGLVWEGGTGKAPCLGKWSCFCCICFIGSLWFSFLFSETMLGNFHLCSNFNVLL